MNIGKLWSLLAGLTLVTGSVNAEILVKNGDSIAFLGDSITSQGWTNTGGYVHLIVAGLESAGVKVKPYPAGISGHKSNNMLARLDNDVLDKKPTWMTLSCGVNDVWHGANGVDLESYQKNITAIVDQATAKGVKVVILTATPIREQDNADNEKLAGYNDFLRALAQERDLPLADLNADCWAALKAGNGPLTVDGVHMNPEGNLVMAKGVLRALGFTDRDWEQFEQSLLDRPNTVVFAGNANALVWPVSPDQGISLGQYLALKKIVAAKKLDANRVNTGLCLKAWAEVLQQHQGERALDWDKLRKEAGAKLAEKVAEFIKEN
ncbi:MAG: SGNH/GDSL hydrolase family protein [Verrucomicrobiales bacterium]|jgi:lysophospholipase L1-like esterase|nr:SGNH/GDSL hydrolase family protein [Verrucomicrobiales bacterium]